MKGKAKESKTPDNIVHPYAPARESKETMMKPGEQTVPQRQEVAYMTTAKIHNKKVAHDIYKRTMQLPITITQRELLSLAPELWAKVADATIKHRIIREAPT